jgi:hypothetical protein
MSGSDKVTHLIIIDKIGHVHRIEHSPTNPSDWQTCRFAREASQHKTVSLAQILVYKLPACGLCWPDPTKYKTFTETRRG